MRTRTASLAFAVVAAVAMVAGPVAARSSTPVSITLEVNLAAGVETITDQTNFCAGSAESAAWVHRRRPERRRHRRVPRRQAVHLRRAAATPCSIELHAASNRPKGGTTGGWTDRRRDRRLCRRAGAAAASSACSSPTGITDQYEGTLVR